MNTVNLFIVFMVSWWLIFLMVLPFGVKNHHEEGLEAKDGIEMASPVNPKIWKKAGITTILTIIVTLLFWAMMEYNWMEIK
jgi:predicted secreted protein